MELFFTFQKIVSVGWWQTKRLIGRSSASLCPFSITTENKYYTVYFILTKILGDVIWILQYKQCVQKKQTKKVGLPGVPNLAFLNRFGNLYSL